ncbi:MAG TPA: rhomboid family intramembrane serine protease [Hyphomicrobiaceae bacterium]|nr:rhomboid family intramembrane serine protease [Hyphomicrobiaceae bacterium]
MSERQPIFNAPGVVIALLAAFFAVHLGRELLTPDGDERVLELFAFVPDRLGQGAQAYPGGSITAVTQFVSHIFLHGDRTHLLINSAWFLAFATPVARRLGTVRFLAFFFLCGIGGALLFLLLNSAPMVGASGAISGLMGATLRFLFLPLSDGDADALSGNGPAPALSLSQALTNRRILIAVAAWSLFNLLAAWGAQAVLPGVSIAWEAHLGGFFTGFLLFGLFDPRLRSQ